jgi:hypothetical protein
MNENQNVYAVIKDLIEKQKKTSLDYLEKNLARIQMKRMEIDVALKRLNEITGSSLRCSIPTIEAMIFALGSMPYSVGNQIVANKGFVDSLNTLYAIKILLERECDEKIKSSVIFTQK